MNFFGLLQRLGKALMLPIAVLPAAGLLLRLGAEDVLNIPVMSQAGGAIFDNLAQIFAVGIALGFAEGGAGAAGLAGLVGYYVLTVGATAINEDINMGVLAGIIAGLTAGLLYNRFYQIKLPDYLGFFGGKRFVPIVTGGFCFLLAVLFGFIWPPIQAVIEGVGNWIVTSGIIGAFVYGTLNRLLIPVGLHHVLNSLVWFIFGTFEGATGAVTGDLNRYFAGDPTAGTFMVGFYPVMMFGLPAACAAMAHMAFPERRRIVSGVMLSMALTSFLTGITEPIEFTFMFLAPVLYGIHAVLTGLSMALMDILGVKHGFTFSAGAIDYILNYGLSTRGWMVIPFGLVYALIYYFLFRFCIRALKLETPGRDAEDDVATQLAAAEGTSEAPQEGTLAHRYIAALGGLGNIKAIDSCITRLRLTMVNRDFVADESLKALGAKGVIRPGTDSLQVILGPEAESIADQMKTIQAESPNAPPPATPTTPARPSPDRLSNGSTATLTPINPEITPEITPEIRHQVTQTIAALGGANNIRQVEPIALTRLRLELVDGNAIDEPALKAAGIQGIMHLSDHTLHLLVGLAADQFATEMHQQLTHH
ncbi:PTS N-acetyl-D-glucosamine transporter [filamentous cyanobacterium CCP2]|nr:PTS N-acetyl-D-glucosamine transporter [filamentous cyanobacterium CCP2]